MSAELSPMWTKTPPTVAGWYRWREDEIEPWEVVKVFGRDNDLRVARAGLARALHAPTTAEVLGMWWPVAIGEVVDPSNLFSCEWCEEKLARGEATSCASNVGVELLDGTMLPPVPHVGEVRCADCNVAPGGNHHPGCERELCPACKTPVVTCSCSSV